MKMSRNTNSVETLIREGFNLLLEMRGRPDAQRLIPIANAFLQTLLHQAASDSPPIVVSIKAVPIRKR
jgi:hypothetical protein